MTGPPFVSIIVLNWMSAESTARCVRSLKTLDYPNFSVILVDNGSPDGSGRRLQDMFPECAFIQTGGNLGYGAGNNYGIRHALSHGADYAWILNPDVEIEPDSLTRLVGAIQADPSIGVIGPRIVERPERCLVEGGRVDPHAGYRAEHNAAEEGRSEGVVDVDYVIGCSLLAPRKTFEAIGLFREDFFLYYEETEFCLRAKKNSFRVCICRDALNFHDFDFKEKGGFYHYLLTRNSVLLSRIERRHVLRTAMRHLSPRHRGLFRLRRLAVNWTAYLRSAAAVAMGLLKPIKPIPRIA